MTAKLQMHLNLLRKTVYEDMEYKVWQAIFAAQNQNRSSVSISRYNARILETLATCFNSNGYVSTVCYDKPKAYLTIEW